MTTRKQHYFTPHIETVELKPEGVLCGSGNSFPFDATTGTRDPYNENAVQNWF